VIFTIKFRKNHGDIYHEIKGIGSPLKIGHVIPQKHGFFMRKNMIQW
jgi:hypothetical protein